jgi:abequosyltransferase
MPKLSICIPTYNRARFLHELLSSICGQLTADVELVISDNASVDETPQVLKQFQAHYQRICYYRSECNRGPDRNYLEVISRASGEYCWFFGSDDVMPPGAIAQVLSLVASNDDIYLLDRIECDLEMRPLAARAWLTTQPRTFDFADDAQLVTYLRCARSVGALFSFLSSIIVRRASWNTITYDETFTGTGYSHAFVLMSLVSSGSTLVYAKHPMVLCRMYNDGFTTNMRGKRLLLDFDGYIKIADHVFSNRPAARREVFTLLCREHPWWRYALVANDANKADWTTLKSRLQVVGFSPIRLVAAETLGSLTSVTRVLTRLMKEFRKVKRLVTSIANPALGRESKTGGAQP